MATVATRKTRVGDLIKMEAGLEHGYERESRTLTVSATAEIGEVYAADGTIVVIADIAGLSGNDICILVDDAVYTDGLGAGTRAYAVLAGGAGASGAAIVVREQLKFGDGLSSGNIDSVEAVLNEKGIKVANQQ